MISRTEKWYRKKSTYALALLIVMVASTIGFALVNNTGQQGGTSDYNGYAFTGTPQGWMSTINGQRIAFAYHPAELEQISMPQISRGQGRVYLLSHPNETAFDFALASQRFAAFLQFVGTTPQPACITEDGCGNIPVRSCTDTFAMVYYRGGNESRAYQEGNCVVLEAPDDYEMSRLSERAIFQILGIMP